MIGDCGSAIDDWASWQCGRQAGGADASPARSAWLRVMGLCLVEGGLLPSGALFHDGLGAMLFAAGAVLIVEGVHLLSRRAPALVRRAGQSTQKDDPQKLWRHGLSICAYLLACLLALAGTGTQRDSVSHTDIDFPGWPDTFEGQPLQPTPLDEREAAFNTAFPGRIGRFTCGGRVVILRWVARSTHRVHSATDCLRSAGWRIDPGALHVDASGNWSTFTASMNGQRLYGRERCEDNMGRTWPDVSSWFWHTMGGRSEKPWWVVTVVEQGALLSTESHD